MIMKSRIPSSRPKENGSALALTLILTTIALAILASVMAWSTTSARLTHRSIQYTRSVAAAEAATEKVVSEISRDFLYGGEQLVSANLDHYRSGTVPTTSDSSYWSSWRFDDANGNAGYTHVERTPGLNYVVLGSTYAGLKGYVSTYTVVSHASDDGSSQQLKAGVLQELQLAGIPIFQFAMYSSGNMEISCGQPFSVTGRVHANKELFVEPDNALTFESGVTAVVDIHDMQRDPLDTRGAPSGGVVYVYPDQRVTPVAAMTLPIGTTNTPEAIREIIEPPPIGEDPTTPIGRLRYYNQCDMVVKVTDTDVIATSGRFNNFGTLITNSEVALFISTNASFLDNRESKTVLPVDIDIGALKTWSETNSNLRLAMGTAKLNSVYVVDNRTLPGNTLNAVRVLNGTQLPTNGLTVATGRPLYVLGDFNAPVPGSTNTANTRPASLVADALTILSANWSDANSTADVSARVAAPTTVNAAFLTGVVETTQGHYSGGMENFPRFLESWGLGNAFTYNGSMVKMFPSLYATNAWGKANVYVPPRRNWAYDASFDNPTRLPPKTPSLLKVLRTRWTTTLPDQNVAAATP
jgi:hypothetical protein